MENKIKKFTLKPIKFYVGGEIIGTENTYQASNNEIVEKINEIIEKINSL